MNMRNLWKLGVLLFVMVAFPLGINMVVAQPANGEFPGPAQAKTKYTHAERKAAADRAKALGLTPGVAPFVGTALPGLPPGLAPISGPAPVAAAPVLDPGGIPHYYGPYAELREQPAADRGRGHRVHDGGGTGRRRLATVDPLTGAITGIRSQAAAPAIRSAPTSASRAHATAGARRDGDGDLHGRCRHRTGDGRHRRDPATSPRDPEVRGHAPGAGGCRRQQPGAVHPRGGAGHHQLPGDGLLRDRDGAVPGADAQRPAADAPARLRAARDGDERRRQQPPRAGERRAGRRREPHPARRPPGARRRGAALSRATRSPRRRTGPCGSCSATFCRPASRAICSFRSTPRSWAPAWGPTSAASRSPTRSTPCAGRRRSPTGCFKREPGDAPPPRRHHAVDQRRDARTSGSTPADDVTPYPKGVSASNVPDMPDPGPGSADVLLDEPAERAADVLPRPCVGHHAPQRLRGRGRGLHHHGPDGGGAGQPGVLPPEAAPARHPGQDLRAGDNTQLAMQDPTWDVDRWGGEGSLWLPHVYVPAQNPGDESGVNQFGRWAYGPWFWPPTIVAPHTRRSRTTTTTRSATPTSSGASRL